MTTFNRITKNLQKTITKLHRLSAKQEALVKDKEDAIIIHQRDIVALTAEGKRAELVANRITDLIGS